MNVVGYETNMSIDNLFGIIFLMVTLLTKWFVWDRITNLNTLLFLSDEETNETDVAI